MQSAKNNYAQKSRYDTRALAILFLAIDCQSIWALENSSTQPAQTLRIDIGENYGIYTLPYGLLIEPRWSPYFNIHYENDNVVADVQSGLGYKILNNETFNAGISLVYQYGRHESADNRYRGMGDIASAPASSLFMEWIAFSGALDLNIETGESIGSSSSRYETVEATIGAPLSNAITGFIDIVITGGDARYTQSFYGVTQLQASRSGYDVYKPNAGLTTASSVMGISYQWTKQWEIIADMGTSRAIDAAASSPLVTHRKSPTGGLVLNYKFQ